MLELVDVWYEVEGKAILKGIKAKFEEQKVYAILGTNGAGKSTLAYLIMGLEGYRPSRGKILLDGEDITDFSVTERARRGITLMWQEPSRFTGIKIKDYLTLGGRRPVPDEELYRVLRIVGLNPHLYLERYVDEKLSGGERKRVELASILLLKPRYTILDEPDSGIDIMSLEMIENVLSELVSNGGSVILVTHREEIALESDYAYLICHGAILKEGVPDDIVQFYKSSCDRCDHPNEPQKEMIE
ncbi:ABC transporter ATP-binding protein [Thermotoga sp. KOL6]|uniref:ABC transporter ATP-binding protein n=1 Tax=Thermotoga sp. KOL6 TaxID=126741 RepID=UPI000CA7A379|nr:ABC transporter ATP-binding protein [Thermotoga sp. KOL6]PLV60157.1 ABC transporter ATP-binding protein [Thermotoga sp. KOL6]